MFQERYKDAYRNVKPRKDSMERILAKAAKNGRGTERAVYLRPVIGGLAVCLILSFALPVCAANIPAVYNMIEKISPEMADLFVPVEKSSISQGIEMQVEAIRLDGNTAEVVVSFRDTGDLDRIHGRAEIYGSYNLTSINGAADISGCSFIEYKEEADKAYFKVSLSGKEAFDREKLTFQVGELLCDLGEEERPIDLSNLETQADTKPVSLSGRSANSAAEAALQGMMAPAGEGDPRPRTNVLDMNHEETLSPGDFTLTGVAYMDEVLRVQYCLGDNTHADRHIEPYLLMEDGTRRDSDYSLSWHEDVGDKELTFYEFGFTGPFDSPEELPLYGTFYDTGESVKGNWNVTFRLEQEMPGGE